MKRKNLILSKSKGQGLVEYSLILVLSVLLAMTINNTKDSTEDYLHSISQRENEFNNSNIVTPDEPTPDKAWDNRFNSNNHSNDLKPVAYFTAPNPVYTGEKVSYWDGSYDPDGILVKREWTGQQSVFNTEGDYNVCLTVTDDDNMTDSYCAIVKVRKRDEYTKLVYDHPRERRTELSRSAIYNVGGEQKRIIDHIHGTRKDLYGIEHLVIEKNLWKYTQEKAQDITYKVTIPIIEVTYYGNGTEKSRKPYIVNGRQATVEQIEVQTVPQPADIKAGSKSGGSIRDNVAEDNTWTFFVYNRVSSVTNPNGGYGDKSPSYDAGQFGSRLDPEEKLTTQNPSFFSSRTTEKDNVYHPGYNIPSSKCPTCTEPNRFVRQSQHIDDYRSVSARGNSWSIRSHTRTHNWIEHESYDWAYKYTGVGFSAGNSPSGTLMKLLRNEWITEGWQPAEQVGGVTSDPSRQRSDVQDRPKYTDCEGSGWSESCWKPQYNTTYSNDSWEHYDTDTWEEEREVTDYSTCRWEEEKDEVTGVVTSIDWVCDDKTEYRDCTQKFYKRKEWYYNWYGTEFRGQDYNWGYRDDTTCTSWS